MSVDVPLSINCGKIMKSTYCVKYARIWVFRDPYFSTLGQNLQKKIWVWENPHSGMFTE